MKKDEFKELIKLAGNDQAPAGFTSSLMKLVELEAEKNEANELQMVHLLKQNGIERPSATFSADILATIEKQSSTAAKPLIGRFGWMGMAACLSVLLLYGFVGQSAEVSQQNSLFLGSIDKLILGFTPKLSNMPILYPVTIAAASFLLLLDSFLRKQTVRKLRHI